MSEAPNEPPRTSRLVWVVATAAVVIVAAIVAIVTINLHSEDNSSSQGAAASASATTRRHTETITDEAGRQVSVQVPVQRAYSSYSYTTEFIRALGGVRSIVATDSSYDPAKSPTNADYWSAFAKLPAVSSTTTSKDIDYDALIAANPEVAFFLSNEDYKTAAAKLEPFGIKVVVVSTSNPSNFEKDLDILSRAYDAAPRAQQIRDFYADITHQLTTRLAGTSAVDTYWENGSANTTTAAGSVWENLITLAGGRNIFGDINFNDPHQHPSGFNFATPVDPAAILERNPAYVFRLEISSSISGQTPFTHDHASEVLGELASRPGWARIKAVQNKNVFVLNNFLISALNKQLGALTIASLLHPDKFKDLDLDKYFRKWVVDFQGVPAANYRPVTDYYYQYTG
ncbi:MAG: ABC transporter substrate-binding protein [Gordonia sp. (in: high G+C Gram-positive bacteria)]